MKKRFYLLMTFILCLSFPMGTVKAADSSRIVDGYEQVQMFSGNESDETKPDKPTGDDQDDNKPSDSDGGGDGELPYIPDGGGDGEQPYIPDGGGDGELPYIPDGGGDGEQPYIPDGGGDGEQPDTPDDGGDGEQPDTPDDGGDGELPGTSDDGITPGMPGDDGGKTPGFLGIGDEKENPDDDQDRDDRDRDRDREKDENISAYVVIIVIGSVIIAVMTVIIIVLLKSRKKDNITGGVPTMTDSQRSRRKILPKAEPGGTPLHIDVLSGNYQVTGNDYAFTEQLMIGRGKQCDVVFADSDVSEVHAKIIIKDNMFYLVDMSSKSGTYLEGMRIQEMNRLDRGDEIAVGSARFRIM